MLHNKKNPRNQTFGKFLRVSCRVFVAGMCAGFLSKTTNADEAGILQKTHIPEKYSDSACDCAREILEDGKRGEKALVKAYVEQNCADVLANKINPRVIWGEDDRYEPFVLHNNLWKQAKSLKNLSKQQRIGLHRTLNSVALIVSGTNLYHCPNSGGWWLKTSKPRPWIESQQKHYDFCSKVRFSEQRVGATSAEISPRCTGFVAGPKDTLITAGHCIKHKDGHPQKGLDPLDPATKGVYAVFGFYMFNPTAQRFYFNNENVIKIEGVDHWKCQGKKEVCGNNKLEFTYLDFAILKMSEKLQIDKTPELWEYNASELYGRVVGFAGHPEGAPLKFAISTEGKIGKYGEHHAGIEAPLDVFVGNSGSPVFLRSDPERIVGMLVHGQMDYVLNTDVTPHCASNNQLDIGDEYQGEYAIIAREFKAYAEN